MVDPHQPSEFEPSTTHAAATHFEDRIAANMMNASMASNPCEDLTPVAHNKSDKSNSHQQEDDTNTCTDQSQPAENVRVNLDESKFSINLPAPAKEDKFLRNFRPGNNSPFTEEEGMLASWSPSKKISPKAVTVEDAWLYGLTKIEPVPSGRDYVSYSFVFADLNCDQCSQYHASPRIVIGDRDYLKMLRYSNDYMQYQFILSFAYLVAHVSHIEPKSGRCGRVSKGHMPFLLVITYEKQTVIETDLLTVPHLYKTIVGIFHSRDHYAIAEVDHVKSRIVTIYDGLYWPLSTWMDNITQLLKKCRLMDLDVLGIECIPDLPSKLIIPGHRRGKEMVNGITIVVNRVKWRVVRGNFLVQHDSYNCGPLACLKLMEVYHRIDLATSEKCYERGRIRSVIVDEWERLVQACDDDGILRVKDVPSDVAGDDCGSHRHNHQEAGNSIGATAGKKQAGDDNSCSRFFSRYHLEDVPTPEDGPTEPDDVSHFDSTSEVEHLAINDENGLFFRPDCTSLCITKSDNGDQPCHKGHTNVVHASLNSTGQYVFFPAMSFHRGYYNSQAEKIFITAQLFAVFKSPHISRHSRRIWNDSRFYQVQGVLPEKLGLLRDDLLAYWDEHYPCSSYAPPERYKNTKIDTKSNRVIQKKDFTKMRHVQELVTMFETIHHELEIESVWFIKKSRRGDGFQRWHQDLVGIGTTVATIVVNIDSVDKEDEAFEVEKIRQQVGTNVKVCQQVGSDVKVRDTSCPDEAEESVRIQQKTAGLVAE